MAPQPPPATWAALAQHPRLYEMLGSVLMGVALGLVLLLVLSAFPGEPFDYSKPDGGRAEREHVQRTAAPVEKEEPVRAGGGDKATTRTTTLRQRGGGGGRGAIPEAPSDVHQDDEAEALHRLLGQEDRLWQQYQRLPVALRRLLGLSEERVRKAARETRRQATAAGGGGRGEEGKAGGYGEQQGQLSSRVDMVFYILAFSALIYVYRDAASHLFRQFFPKEAAVLGMR